MIKNIVRIVALVIVVLTSVLAHAFLPGWQSIPEKLHSINDLKKLAVPFNTSSSYVGDGTYAVGVGDSVQLDNGVKVTIRYIGKDPWTSKAYGALNRFLLYVDFSSGTARLNPVPQGISLMAIPINPNSAYYRFQGYGVSIELPFGNEKKLAPVSLSAAKRLLYKFKFTSPLALSQPVTPEGLYNYCMDHELQQLSQTEKRRYCIRYVPYTPLTDEIKLADNKISIISPAADETANKYYYEQALYCYATIKNALNIEPLFKPVPIRLMPLSPGNASAITSPDTGILMHYAKQPSLEPGISTQCNNPTLLHEMVHYFLAPAPLSDILNEGIANWVSQDNAQLAEISLIQSDITIGKKLFKVPGDSGLWIQLMQTYLTKDTNEPRALFSYGVMQSTTYSVIDYLGVTQGHGVTALQDTNVPIIALKEIGVDEAGSITMTVDFYNNQQLFPKLNCSEQGYYKNSGWMTDTGLMIMADDWINPITPFFSLSKYLTELYPYNEYAEQFYDTAACLWDTIDASSFLIPTINQMRQYQTFANTPFPLLDFLSASGMDIASLKMTYGLNLFQLSASAYSFPLQGNMGMY